MTVYGIQFWIECKGGLKTANELSDALDDLVYDGNLSLAYDNHSIMGAGLFMKNAIQNNFESIREILNEFADKIKYVSEWDYEDSSDMKWGVHTLGESKKSARKSIKEKMDSKSEEIYYLLYRLFELNLIQTSDYDEDRFDEITDYIEKNGVDKSYKNEAYKLAMQYINHNFSNGKEYKEIIKKFLDLFGLQVNTHSVEWNIISESKKSVRKSIKESINANSILSKVETIVDKTKIKHPKAEIIELDGTKYIYYSYFDRGFDDDGLDRVWDKCSDLKGVVDVGFGYGYGLENTKYENALLIELDDDVIVESKKSARKSIKESLNFKKDYDVEVSGGNYWFKPFYWDFDEFRDDLLIASEESGFTYHITTASSNKYRINIEFNNSPSIRNDITFRIIPKSNKETSKELNDYLN